MARGVKNWAQGDFWLEEFAPFQPTVVFETDASMGGIRAYSP